MRTKEKKGNKHENEIKVGNKIRGASQDEFSVSDTGKWLGAATDENSYNEELYPIVVVVVVVVKPHWLCAYHN